LTAPAVRGYRPATETLAEIIELNTDAEVNDNVFVDAG
jgi:hypothetical protein